MGADCQGARLCLLASLGDGKPSFRKEHPSKPRVRAWHGCWLLQHLILRVMLYSVCHRNLHTHVHYFVIITKPSSFTLVRAKVRLSPQGEKGQLFILEPDMSDHGLGSQTEVSPGAVPHSIKGLGVRLPDRQTDSSWLGKDGELPRWLPSSSSS